MLFEIWRWYFLDVSNKANVLLISLKEIVDKLQSEKAFFKTQVEKLTIEKKQLAISNKNLKNRVNMLEKDLKIKALLLVLNSHFWSYDSTNLFKKLIIKTLL